MKKVIVFIAGMPGSGKSIALEYLKRLGFKTFSLGDVVREIVEQRGLEKTQTNLLKVAEEIRLKWGNAGVAELLIRKLGEVQPPIAIDGVRSIEEIKVFRRISHCIHVIAIYSPSWLRFQRIRLRNRPGDPVKYEEFLERDLKELSFGLGNVIALSDTIIINEGTIEDMEKQLEKNLERIMNCREESTWKFL
ncbi:MAG: AAA family ATPase [Fervidicoccaceae archaeon]|jgi:dephospho-CoA kinase|nr:MAG: dephospho-CoA kinase [Fervidicoccus fontis]